MISEPSGTTIEANVLFVAISSVLEQMVSDKSSAKLFFTIQDNTGDQFYTSVAKHPEPGSKQKPGDILQADFNESFIFTVTPQTEFLQIKVMAAIVEKQPTHSGTDNATTSEKLI